MKTIPGVVAALVLAMSSLVSGDVAALTDEEWQICANQAVVETLNFSVAPIKSEADLKSYLREGGARKAPLNRLSHRAQQRFIRSITFNEKGVTGYRYDDLEAELTLSQAYAVLALFGEQHNIKFVRNARVESELDRQLLAMISAPAPACSGDRDRYECIRPGTCKSSVATICTRNC